MIDTHSHIYAQEFAEDIDVVMARAIDAGVTMVLLPNIDLDSLTPLYALVSKYPDACKPMMGLHPCSVKEDYKEVLNSLEKELESRTFCGIGEVGMDLYWDKNTVESQKDALRIQFRWAKKYDLPVSLHTRDATEEVLAILTESEFKNQISGVFHCFTGDVFQAKRIIAQGFLLGIGGVVSFKNTHLREVLSEIDLDHLVLETDAPYLAPMPFRGKRNEPAHLVEVSQVLAEVYKIPVEEIKRLTTINALKVFKL